jgi:hypothetical protein
MTRRRCHQLRHVIICVANVSISNCLMCISASQRQPALVIRVVSSIHVHIFLRRVFKWQSIFSLQKTAKTTVLTSQSLAVSTKSCCQINGQAASNNDTFFTYCTVRRSFFFSIKSMKPAFEADFAAARVRSLRLMHYNRLTVRRECPHRHTWMQQEECISTREAAWCSCYYCFAAANNRATLNKLQYAHVFLLSMRCTSHMYVSRTMAWLVCECTSSSVIRIAANQYQRPVCMWLTYSGKLT